MAHNRKFCSSAVSLVMGRAKQASKQAIKARDLIEEILVQEKILDPAPFRCIGLMYRYGTKNMLEPEYKKIAIDPKYNEVSIAIELQMAHMLWCDQNDVDLLFEILMIGALDSVIHVCEKYNLNTAPLKVERLNYREIPETLEELQKMSAESKPMLH